MISKCIEYNAFLSIFIRGISIVAQIFSSVVVGRYFTNSELATFYLIIPICTIFTFTLISPVSILKINQGIKNGGFFNDFLPVVYCYLIPIGILAFSLINLLEYFDFESFPFIFSIYILIEIIFGTIIGLIIQIYSIKGRLIISSSVNLFVVFTTSFFPIIIGYLMGWNISSWIYGLISARLIQSVLFYFLFIDFRFVSGIINNALNFYKSLLNDKLNLFILFSNNILIWLANNFIKIFITIIIGLDLSAPYLFFLSVSASLAFALESLFNPILSNKLLSNLDKKSNDIIYIYINFDYRMFFYYSFSKFFF